MKEYWVNVYEDVNPYHCHKNVNKARAINTANLTSYDWPIYRLHVREFDTKEAKELNMKYGRPI